jgi:hypothetical protein
MEDRQSSLDTKIADLRIYTAYLGITIYIIYGISRTFLDTGGWYLILGGFAVLNLAMNIYLLKIYYQLRETSKILKRLWVLLAVGIGLVVLCFHAGGLF